MKKNQEKQKLERIVRFFPAWDKRHSDPSKNYGIGSVRVIMLLRGQDKAVHFVFGSGMYLQKTHREWLNRFPNDHEGYMGYDFGYHMSTPQFEGQEVSRENCEWINGACYNDGSSLAAADLMKILVSEGDEPIWKRLEEYYYELK